MNNFGPMLTAGVALIAAVLTYVAGTRSAKTRYEALKVAIEIRGLRREDEQEDWDRVVRKHVAYEHSRSVVSVHTTAAGILMASSALIIFAGYVGG